MKREEIIKVLKEFAGAFLHHINNDPVVTVGTKLFLYEKFADRLTEQPEGVSEELICCGTCRHMNDGECICADECHNFNQHYHISKGAKPISEEGIDDIYNGFSTYTSMEGELYMSKAEFKAALSELNNDI